MKKLGYSLSLGYRKWISNIESGNNQNKYRKSHGPVVNPYCHGPLCFTNDFFHCNLLIA